MVLSGTNTLSDSQSTINALGRSALANGTQLTLNLNVAFSSKFTGPKAVWMAAQAISGHHANWEAMGAWKVP